MTWATDHIFVAGGDFVVDSWREFQRQAGVTAVITIDTGKPGEFTDPAPWAALWLPVEDERAYTLEHLQLGVFFIESALTAGRKVLLHAPRGVHRTRPLVAAHLIAQGKSVARVVREMEQKPWLPPYQGNRELLEQMASME